ncbi:hypothetical protein [Sterolibacterium denitrificans]|uniref:hypothetical protein n=1 Tax=Sterolibacterium denitrificans TaxID=157592 RepID=UPI000A75CCA7|nr:hypothetical protein [Sterolibacterium denitrificans]
MIIRKKQISSLVLCISMLLFFISESFLSIGDDIAFQLKLLATVAIIFTIFLGRYFDRWLFLVPLILLFLFVNYFRGAVAAAAAEELLRYLLPMLILLTLYANRKSIDILAKAFIWIVLSNDLYQAYAYFAYFNGLPVLIPIRFEAGYIIRAEGWVGFFSLFGFMNFCALMIVRYTGLYEEKNKNLLSAVFMVFSLLSASFKLAFAYMALVVFNAKNKTIPIWGAILLLSITVFAHSQKDLAETFLAVVDSKIAFYITERNSARAESYRVMLESLAQPNFTGEGLGMFGGPASTKYGSPLYSKYNFDWHNTINLTTTDTFYPHLFVELGLLGGIIYLLFLFRYGQSKRTTPWMIISIALLADTFFSFSILSVPYFLSAVICMLLFSREKTDEKPSR